MILLCFGAGVSRTDDLYAPTPANTHKQQGEEEPGRGDYWA